MKRKNSDLSQVISAVIDSLQSEFGHFLKSLVQIPSLPGEEQEAQSFIAEKLKTLDLEVTNVQLDFNELKKHPAFNDDGLGLKSRFNVVALWEGSQAKLPTGGKARSLILNGHIDVVSPGNESLWKDSPWSGRIKDGRLFGRGACDMKAGLACAVYALQALRSLGFRPAGDILCESVVGEESGGMGTLATLVKGYSAQAAIILEPTGLKICPVQAGALTFRIKITGRSAHACLKKEGVSAIEKFCRILRALQDLEKERHARYSHPLYADPEQIAPLNVGTIRGGDWHSTVPEEVVAEGRFGIFPGESVIAGRAALATALSEEARRDPWLRDHEPVLEWFDGQYEPAQTDSNESFIKTLGESFEEMTHRKSRLEGVTYGSDLGLFVNHGKIPAALFGPGDVAQAHAANEFVGLDEAILATKILALAVFNWTGMERA